MENDRHIVHARCEVLEVRQRKIREYVRGYGEKAEFNELHEGWSLVLKGSPTPFSIDVGGARPNVSVGEFVQIDIRRES